MDKLIQLLFAIFCLVQSAHACDLDLWQEATAQAKSASQGTIRFEGRCSLVINQGEYVKREIIPLNDTYIRFYLYETSSNADEIHLLSAKQSDGQVDFYLRNSQLVLSGKSHALSAKTWHQIEIQVNAGVTNVWVDSLLVFEDIVVENTAVTNLAIGDLSSTLGSTLYIDALAVSNEPIQSKGVSIGSDKTLIPGDANGDGKVDLLDPAVIMFDPLTGGSNGVADCNINGKVNIIDAICALLKR